MNNVNCTSHHNSGAMRSAYCTLRLLPEVMAGTVLVPPPIRRGEGARSGAPSGMMAQPQPAQGPDRERASAARPDLAREQDVRSGLWPKPWMAKAKVPSAAVRPTLLLIRGQPRSGRIGGDGRSIGDFSLATQRKVTRPSPKGGRKPFEASGLASCTAKPCHHTTAPAANTIPRNGRLRLTANRPYKCTAQPCPLATGTEFGRTHRVPPVKGGVAAPIGPRRVPSP